MTPAQALPGARSFLASLKAFRAGVATTAPIAEGVAIVQAADVVIAAAEKQLAALERIAAHSDQLAAMPASPAN
jgi:hypothetical protein